MPTHSTNYYNTLIEIAEDCPLDFGQVPPAGKRSVAERQFELIRKEPYTLTSDDVIFQIFADKNELLPEEYEDARFRFFSKGQACLRTSPLAKRYGFGIHFNPEGRIALYGAETADYLKLLNDPVMNKVKAMRSSKKKD